MAGSSSFENIKRHFIPGEPKNGTHKIFTLQNRNICDQDTDTNLLKKSNK